MWVNKPCNLGCFNWFTILHSKKVWLINTSSPKHVPCNSTTLPTHPGPTHFPCITMVVTQWWPSLATLIIKRIFFHLMEFSPNCTYMCNIVFRHILPASLMNDSMNASDSFYVELLSHGEPVIVYMHGNSGSRGSPHRVELYTLLRNMNYHVITFDYRSKILI